MNLFPNYSLELSHNINNIILDYDVGDKKYWKQVYNSVLRELLKRILNENGIYIFKIEGNSVGFNYLQNGNCANRIRYINGKYVYIGTQFYTKSFLKFMGRNDI